MKTNWLIIMIFIPILSSCIEEDELYNNTYRENFEALWEIVDTRYCYLDEKKINWDSVYTVYNARLKEDTVSEIKFFDAMAEMLAELKDGHVNLYSSFDRSRYGKWFTNYPANFRTSLILGPRYLGDKYRSVNGLRYQKIADGKVGYLYYSSFSDGFSDQNFRYIFEYFKDCRGLIIDVRGNGGGSAELSNTLAGYFFDRDTTSIYMRHKTGPGHSDFSEAVPMKTDANKDLSWRDSVVVLANRSSYSATNMFVCRMKDAPKATVMGDVSGGGGGVPLSDELPNGWMVRFSASPMYDKDMKTIEFGIQPDIAVALDSADASKGIDTIIERAVLFLTQQ
jgi:hypothetical protein